MCPITQVRKTISDQGALVITELKCGYCGTATWVIRKVNDQFTLWANTALHPHVGVALCASLRQESD